MTEKQLAHLLEVYSGIEVSQNTLSSYVRELCGKKYIAENRGIYRANQFIDYELRLLIDGALLG